MPRTNAPTSLHGWDWKKRADATLGLNFTRKDTMQQSVTFPSDGLALSGIVHIPDGLKSGERRLAIIMMHGFGANKDGGPEWVCEQFESWGYVALRFDYRGCGESEGEPGRVIAMEEVSDARNALTYMASRPEVDGGRIALCGSSLGAGVAVYAAGIDDRVAAVILENGLGNGERIIRGMHTPESWNAFLNMMEDGLRYRERTGESKMIHRFDIFEMPKELQVNLTSNGSLMQFTAETAVSFFTFRPEEMMARISPRPVSSCTARATACAITTRRSASRGWQNRRLSCICSTVPTISCSSMQTRRSRSPCAAGWTGIFRSANPLRPGLPATPGSASPAYLAQLHRPAPMRPSPRSWLPAARPRCPPRPRP